MAIVITIVIAIVITTVISIVITIVMAIVCFDSMIINPLVTTDLKVQRYYCKYLQYYFLIS